MFSCTKCNEPLFMQNAELKDRILKMDVQCLRGHKSIRRLAEHQAMEMSEDLFSKIFVCLDCGSIMSLLDTQTQGSRVDGIFLCPIHGQQKREFPSVFLPTIGLLDGSANSVGAVIDSFRCERCGQVYAVSDMEERYGVLEMEVRSACGHKSKRYVSTQIEDEVLEKILQRVVHCDRCNLPGHIIRTEKRGKSVRVHASCPVHGVVKKDIPIELLDRLEVAVNEIPEDAIVDAMLVSRDCHRPLAIRRIEEDKTGYKFRCVCPAQGHTSDLTLPVNWTEPISKRITTAVLTCDECGLFTDLTGEKKRKNRVDFKVVCPIHGVMARSAPPDVFNVIAATEPTIDRLPSIVRSLSCQKCNMPLTVHDVEHRRGLVEFDMECRNGHRSKRFLVPDVEQETLVGLYKHLYQCPECHDPLDLVYIEPYDHESRVVLLCPIHGKYVLDIPPNHAKAMNTAYEDMQADRLKPPVEVKEEEEKIVLESLTHLPQEPTQDVQVYRGCEVVGGKFEYKVKVKNNSGYVITNVTVSIVAYPKDCMELTGETVKTISRIEVGGFRSPQFSLFPTKDCVQGKVVATVSYIDFRDQLHTLQVEPFLVRSVCDLLKPNKKTSKEFDLILDSLEIAEQEQTLDWNARVLFTKAEKLLPAKNFHIVDAKEQVIGGQFIGTIRGYAEGKYTSKKVAVVLLISGPETGRHAVVKVEALGEDIAMLPTTIDELAESMGSWICLRCGAPLEPEQVDELGKRLPIRCRYCSHSLTIALYLQ